MCLALFRLYLLCKNAGGKTSTRKSSARVQEQKLCREKFMQVAWCKTSTGKSSASVQEQKLLQGNVAQGCRKKKLYTEKFRKGAAAKTSFGKCCARVQRLFCQC